MTTLSLYEHILGDRYARLPAAVQSFHRLGGHAMLPGHVKTLAPRSWIARVLACLLGSPREDGEGPLRFELQADPEGEVWTRHFPSRTMTSRMRRVGSELEERLGAAQLRFRLTAHEDHLGMSLVHMRFLGVPCPAWLMPRIVAEERGIADQLHFRVTAALPWVGAVTHYEGYLKVPGVANRASP